MNKYDYLIKSFFLFKFIKKFVFEGYTDNIRKILNNFKFIR